MDVDLMVTTRLGGLFTVTVVPQLSTVTGVKAAADGAAGLVDPVAWPAADEQPVSARTTAQVVPSCRPQRDS